MIDWEYEFGYSSEIFTIWKQGNIELSKCGKCFDSSLTKLKENMDS